jgi:hypothetical protein
VKQKTKKTVATICFAVVYAFFNVVFNVFFPALPSAWALFCFPCWICGRVRALGLLFSLFLFVLHVAAGVLVRFSDYRVTTKQDELKINQNGEQKPPQNKANPRLLLATGLTTAPRCIAVPVVLAVAFA